MIYSSLFTLKSYISAYDAKKSRPSEERRLRRGSALHTRTARAIDRFILDSEQSSGESGTETRGGLPRPGPLLLSEDARRKTLSGQGLPVHRWMKAEKYGQFCLGLKLEAPCCGALEYTLWCRFQGDVGVYSIELDVEGSVKMIQIYSIHVRCNYIAQHRYIDAIKCRHPFREQPPVLPRFLTTFSGNVAKLEKRILSGCTKTSKYAVQNVWNMYRNS